MDVPVAADLSFMREVNTTAILQILRSHDRISVAEIASAAGLSRQAVSRSLTDLRAAGLVEMLPPERFGGRSGRPAQLVRFRAEAGYVLGAFIDPAQARVAVADLTGTIVHASVVALGKATDGADAVDELVAQVRVAIAEAGLTPAEVVAASVGVPGIVDPEAGVARLVASMPGLSGDVVVKALTDCLECTVYLDNDVKLATLGEQWRGVQRDEESLVVVHWGERIGAGILLDGSLYRGANNDAGDLGFLDLIADAQDQQTSNPELGRFEEWAGASALIHLTTAELAAADDSAGSRALRDAGESALDLIMAGLSRGEQPYLAALDTIAQRFGA
ncbi:MAG: ROK family transcriptional regulator, partial [Propionibacteriaceae bacterium]